MTKFNLRRAKKLRDTIANAEPDLCRMSAHKSHTDCGTAYCIEGYARVLFPDEGPVAELSKILGISHTLSEHITYMFDQTSDFGLGDLDDLPTLTRRTCMVDMLDQLIASNGLEASWHKALSAHSSEYREFIADA